MQSLSLALKAKTDEGLPLPQPFRSLAQIDVLLRKGQMSLWAGAPGTGKSAVAVELSKRMRVPTIYFSADADRMTMARGLLAGVLQQPQAEVEKRLTSEDPTALKALEESSGHIWWNFDPGIDSRDVSEELEAYAYVYGAYPDMIVVDNLMDMAEDDTKAMSNAQVELKGIARKYGCHVMVLAHLVGEYTDGDRPVPRSAMMWKPDKKAEMICTIYRPEDGVMHIGVVKNRGGQANTNGTWGVRLRWLPRLGYFGD